VGGSVTRKNCHNVSSSGLGNKAVFGPLFQVKKLILAYIHFCPGTTISLTK
jgi:hypothetical protein